MRGSTVFFGFLFLLLPLAALGHDGYMAYKHPELGDLLHAFRFSDVGWMWLHYSKDTYEMMKDSISEASWGRFVDPVLRQTTALVAAIPLIILICAVLVAKLFKNLQLTKAGAKNASYGRGDKKNSQAFKYKRK